MINRIARALFAVWLFCWPAVALAHVLPTSRDAGFLHAGAVHPGSIEGITK